LYKGLPGNTHIRFSYSHFCTTFSASSFAFHRILRSVIIAGGGCLFLPVGELNENVKIQIMQWEILLGLSQGLSMEIFLILKRVIISRIEVTGLSFYALDFTSIIARCPLLQSCGMELLD
jgi:hypothetical protein